MVEKKVIGGREVYVEDRSKVTEAARDLVRNPTTPGAVDKLQKATNDVVQPKRTKD